MNLDGLLIGKYALKLSEYFPAKINKISQISENEFLFQIRSQGKNNQLFISTQSKSYRFYLSDLKYNTSFEPSTFLMVLRKMLTQSIILNVTQLNGDRCIKFEIETLNNLKDKIKLYLYIELFGKYTNIILVNQDNKIIDCLKRSTLSSNRILLPQANFEPSYNIEKFSLFERQDQPLNNYNGISKIISDLNLNPESLYKKLKESETIYFYPKLNKFHLIPLFENEECLTYSLFEAMNKIYFVDENVKRVNELSGNIHQYVKKELEKSNNKLIKLENSLSEAKNLDKFKEYGELLYAFPLKDHISEVIVENFDGVQVTIPLDPKYTIKENAKRYYKKYSKAKTALEMIQAQIDKTKNSISYYNEIQDQLSYIQLEDALEIAQELNLTTKKQIKQNKSKQPNFLMLEVDNVKIYVGKNNIQNDYITNKLSKKHYLWFHVKDFHGSHVVVNQSEVSEEILRLCASLAAYYSKARYSSSIPVNYCLLKQLKATRGNQLGMVFLGSYKTIYIDINEKELLSTIEKYAQ